MKYLVNMIGMDSSIWFVLERLRFIPILAIIAFICLAVFWSIDRSVPFKVLNYVAPPTKAGGILHIEANVVRDVTRDCSVQLSSHIIDSKGVRWDLLATQHVTPDGIREVEKHSPGKLIRHIQLPPGLSVGKAIVQSSNTYRCNPMQEAFFPIYGYEEFAFEVVP